MRKAIATLERIAGELKVVRKEVERAGGDRAVGDANAYSLLIQARDNCLLVAERLSAVGKSGASRK